MEHGPGSLPLYLQIAEGLARDIAAAILVDGARLPPERQLAAQMGVAVGTLRKALGELQARGLLDRRQGSGNYIRARPDPASLYAFFRLELIEGGGLPTARVLSVERLPKPPPGPMAGEAPDAHRIRRLRSLSGTVAALEEIWLDGAYAERIVADDLSESLYLFYRQRLRLSIARAEDRIGLGAVPDWAPPAFALAPGTAVPLVQRFGFAEDGARAEISFTWFDPSVARYVCRIS